MMAKPGRQTKQEQELFDKWLEECPPELQAVARKWHPFNCYRSADNARTHYAITLYGLTQDRKVQISLLHGADSTLPGVTVFGIDAETELAVCACGEWDLPTEEQVECMKEHFAALDRARALAPKKSSAPPVNSPGSKTPTKH